MVLPPPPLPDALAARTLEFIDIQSVSRNEQAFLKHLKGLMPKSFGLAYEGDAVSFFGRATGKADFVVLAGHTDTVPIVDNVPGRREGDVIWGRGSSDMKGGLVLMIELAHWIEQNEVELDFDLGFLFFGREELPSDESALLPALEQSAALRSTTFAVLMEPTSNALELGCQGNLNVTVHYSGTAAHTARPWMGSNAAHSAIKALQDLAIADPHDVDIDGLVFREVANVTAIRGGNARNVIPDSIEVDINIRYAPTRTPQEAEELWIDRLSTPQATVEVISNAQPAPVMSDHRLAKRLLAAGAGSPQPKQAWTNAADFAQYGVPAVNFGPGDPAFAHRDDEQIAIDALVKGFSVLQQFVLEGQS